MFFEIRLLVLMRTIYWLGLEIDCLFFPDTLDDYWDSEATSLHFAGDFHLCHFPSI